MDVKFVERSTNTTLLKKQLEKLPSINDKVRISEKDYYVVDFAKDMDDDTEIVYVDTKQEVPKVNFKGFVI